MKDYAQKTRNTVCCCSSGLKLGDTVMKPTMTPKCTVFVMRVKTQSVAKRTSNMLVVNHVVQIRLIESQYRVGTLGFLAWKNLKKPIYAEIPSVETS